MEGFWNETFPKYKLSHDSKESSFLVRKHGKVFNLLHGVDFHLHQGAPYGIRIGPQRGLT